MVEMIKTAGETAIESGKEVDNTSSVEPAKSLKVDKDNGGKLRITAMKNEPPVYVDLAVIVWLYNAVFNFARITVVPYNTKSKAYLYIIAELDGIVEKRGTFVNDKAIDVILELLNGKGISTEDKFFKQEQEVNDTSNFQLKLLQRLRGDFKRFYREADKERNGITYFRGSFQFYRGEVKFNIPFTDDVKKFIHEQLTINKLDYFNL
ncbi:hypothetical protein [Bacteroides timonensis]|uniref:hypothetical protein n=1 Tax=Bacteroides timonensis TaxID=1470345 RepID=UPI0005C6CB70|nr:hypothetical protein [Bacteroides timonensis]